MALPGPMRRDEWHSQKTSNRVVFARPSVTKEHAALTDRVSKPLIMPGSAMIYTVSYLEAASRAVHRWLGAPNIELLTRQSLA